MNTVQPFLQLNRRIISIDAVRGLVMFIMLVDHVRETVFLHMQVGDPVDVTTTSPVLFILRLMSSFCAPAFVLLAGIGAFIYKEKNSKNKAATFLFSRGLFLVVLEMLAISGAWAGIAPMEKFYLQIIWCIGICMIFLSGLIYLPRLVQILISIVLIAGHNLLDNITFAEGDLLHYPWAILHQRDWLDFFGVPARTSYPVLPWIGVILAGYLLGSWYTELEKKERLRRLVMASSFGLVAFFILRGVNVYGDTPWQVHDSSIDTFFGFFALTKYPLSFAFALFTIPGVGFCLALFEKFQDKIGVSCLSKFGSGALFFYILHLYVLKLTYWVLVMMFGLNKGDYFGVSHPFWVLVWAIALFFPLWWITVQFVRFKERNRHLKWLSYL